jgi:hypothetical protein
LRDAVEVQERSQLKQGTGGPGVGVRSFIGLPTIIRSIRDELLTLPPETVVRPGHGETTSIGAEAPHLQAWIDRGR